MSQFGQSSTTTHAEYTINTMQSLVMNLHNKLKQLSADWQLLRATLTSQILGINPRESCMKYSYHDNIHIFDWVT